MAAIPAQHHFAGSPMPRITAQQAGGANVCAFLDAIAVSENTAELLAASDDGYNVLVGSTSGRVLLFASYAQHPNIYNKRLDSTAAGRYQELYRNWLAYRAVLELPDFGPVSQDLMAIQQIREARALPLIVAGKLSQAISLVAHLWASLPGADYGQHEQQFSMLQIAYTAAGGTLA
jgi:muramidase (phage lysozyme)